MVQLQMGRGGGKGRCPPPGGLGSGRKGDKGGAWGKSPGGKKPGGGGGGSGVLEGGGAQLPPYPAPACISAATET